MQAVVFISAFILALIVGIIILPILKRFKLRQIIRDDGPPTHHKKAGTPTMGGLIFLIPIILLSIILSFKYKTIILLAAIVLGFGAIGFIDDFIIVSKKRKDGLYWEQKMIGLLVVAFVFIVYALGRKILNTEMIIPFMGIDYTITLPVWLFILLNTLVLISVTNAVNLTDGLDGLAASVTLIILVFFIVVTMVSSEWDYIKIFASIAAGGCLGFLVFNIHPAKVFMGDTGSLALGGAVGAISILMKMPWILLIVGIIYVLEVLSDLIQVGYFKYKKKRVFKMAPIHHHFELSGWKETKIVMVFCIITFIFCFFGLLALRLKFY
jgi:phospho-N-acetylmuramoyl-pentapeptide-transferase